MKKYIPIELDKNRNLRFGMVALMKIEEKLGRPFAQIDFEHELKYKDLATILWAGLAHEDAYLTPNKVAELIDDYSDIQTAMSKMGEAMQEAFGKNVMRVAEDVDEENGTGEEPLRTLS
jgi:hypothetical protein